MYQKSKCKISIRYHNFGNMPYIGKISGAEQENS